MSSENYYNFSQDLSDQLIFAEESNFDNELIFAEEIVAIEPKEAWKVLIVDDEPEVHTATKIALKKFNFEEKSLNFIDAYSAKEAEHLIQENPDIAIILLDVIMESDDAGLNLVKFIREVVGNQLIRIVLRTGQPGQIPEKDVIINYDINDYKTKTELTSQKLFTTVLTALRSYSLSNKLQSEIQRSANK